MKKAILLLFYCLLFAVHSSYAQKIRFTDTSNVWTTRYYDPQYPTSFIRIDKWKYTGDTFINSNKYQRLNRVGYVREDTLLRKVYCIPFDDTVERLLHDFSLQVGDTLKQNDTAHYYCNFVVVKIDSVLINGVYHLMQQLNYGLTIIEGVGSNYTPNRLPCFGPDLWYKLICFSNDGNIITAGSISPTTCALGIENVNNYYSYITVTPNPANENSKIVFPYTIQQGRLVVTNAIGQVVLQKEFQQTDRIDLGVLPVEGLCFYTVIDVQNSATFTGKFVYE